jgi:hypothetical protein
VSWLTRQSLHQHHQRQRLFQNKRVFKVFVFGDSQDFTGEPKWLTSNTLCMIIDFQEKTVKTPVDGISPLDFAALQMLQPL